VQSLEQQAPQQAMQVPEEELQFPQGLTGAKFRTVLAVESFVPKFEVSKTRKRERDAERDQKTAGYKKRHTDTKQISKQSKTRKSWIGTASSTSSCSKMSLVAN
jgi:hypothetical protein